MTANLCDLSSCATAISVVASYSYFVCIRKNIETVTYKFSALSQRYWLQNCLKSVWKVSDCWISVKLSEENLDEDLRLFWLMQLIKYLSLRLSYKVNVFFSFETPTVFKNCDVWNRYTFYKLKTCLVSFLFVCFVFWGGVGGCNFWRVSKKNCKRKRILVLMPLIQAVSQVLL